MTGTKPPALDAFAAVPAVAERSPADEVSLPVGRALGIRPLDITREWAAKYVADVRERDPLYAREDLSHPGQLPRLFNWALTHNVVLGPWIHVGSKVDHFAAAKVGDELTVRAKVVGQLREEGPPLRRPRRPRRRQRHHPHRPHLPHRHLPPARGVGWASATARYPTFLLSRTVGLRASRRPKLQLPNLLSRRPRRRASPAPTGRRSRPPHPPAAAASAEPKPSTSDPPPRMRRRKSSV